MYQYIDGKDIPFERILSINEAFSLLEESTLQVDAELECIKSIHPIYKCKLIDNINQQIYLSQGKGFKLHSKVSAIYEALQQFFAFNTLRESNNINYFPTKELNTYNNIASKYKLPEIILSNVERTLPWLKYSSYCDSDFLYYPLPLTEVHLAHIPKFSKYADLNWRSYDAGNAIGYGFEEASIHGINECIETDAYSLLLIGLFIKQPSNTLKLIDKNSLPENLHHLVRQIEETYNDNLLIIDMTSDINVPTFMVSFTKQNCLSQPKGFCASLSKNHALEASLLEALQAKYLYNSNTVIKEKNMADTFKSTPLLMQAALCNLPEWIKHNQTTMVNFSDLIDYSNISNLKEQLNKLNHLLAKRHYKAFYHKYIETKSGLNCLRVIIPGLEEFFLVKEGKFILPNSRGQAIAAEQ